MQSSDDPIPFAEGEERSPEEIERAIAGTRAALENTVEELGERLRPAQIAEDARSYVREKATRGANEAWRNVREKVRDNPLSLALLGGGIAALLALRFGADGTARNGWGRRRDWQLDDFLDGHASGFSRWMASAGDAAGDAGAHAADRVTSLMHGLRDAGVGAGAQQGVRRARGELEALIAQQPLLVGVAGFALGAILARTRASGHRG